MICQYKQCKKRRAEFSSCESTHFIWNSKTYLKEKPPKDLIILFLHQTTTIVTLACGHSHSPSICIE